jgi:hypothetical protein
MTTERSDRVAHAAREAGDRFDYFMAGLCAAIVGYLAQTFRPTTIGLDPASGELLALLVFLAAAICAFKRLESAAHAVRVNAGMLYNQEMRGALTAAGAGGAPILNESTGEYYSLEEIGLRVEMHAEMATKARKTFNSTAESAEIWSRARNWLLLVGVLLLIGSRIWAAYQP